MRVVRIFVCVISSQNSPLHSPSTLAGRLLNYVRSAGAGWADVGEFDIAKRMRNTKIVLPTAPQVLHLRGTSSTIQHASCGV